MTENQTPAPAPPMLGALLGLHSAATAAWVADAASTAAERGLGALYSLLYLKDASGQLAGQKPASRERTLALLRVNQALQTDLTALKFDPKERPDIASALEKEKATAVGELGQALPLPGDRERLRAEQAKLGISEVWLAPLHWGGEPYGVLVLLMPADPPSGLPYAELLGSHVAVALHNLRERDAGRRLGELDAVRWVYDERRFQQQLASEIRRALRHDRPLSIMLLRLANQHALRLRFGRFLADRVLRQIGGRLADTMRDTDFLGAFHDDGFAAILVEADEAGARRAQERLLESVNSIRLPDADLPDLAIDLAYATAVVPLDGETAEDLMAAAESRLNGEARSAAVA